MAAGFPDLLTVLTNVGAVIPSFIMLLQGISAFMGVYMVGNALVEIWGVSHDNAMKYVSGKQKFSIGSAMVTMLIGSILLAMGTLEWMGVMSRSLTGDYASSRMLSYCPPAPATCGGSTLAEQSQMATLALLGIMQVVGFIAMVKGWLTVNNYFNGVGQAGPGQATGWIIGGILAWNFKWFADVLNNTIGFNIIGMFTPF